jgi:hypothetical protein
VVLDLVYEGSSLGTFAIAPGTSNISLDLRLNSGGQTVEGVQYGISTSPSGGITYGPTPITVLDNPFRQSDLVAAPASGATVANNASGTTVFAKSTAGAPYAPVTNQAIARYQFNTASLAPGNYVFTPVGQEFFSSVNSSPQGFDAPKSFTLTVVPEPGAALLAILCGGFVVGMRRSRPFAA